MPRKTSTKPSQATIIPDENLPAAMSAIHKTEESLNHDEIVNDVIREAIYIMKNADKDENKIKAMQLILRHISPEDKNALPDIPHLDWEAAD